MTVREEIKKIIFYANRNNHLADNIEDYTDGIIGIFTKLIDERMKSFEDRLYIECYGGSWQVLKELKEDLEK